MSKVLECIYAYIYKNNFAGSCSLGKQIYTITDGLSPREVDKVAEILTAIDNAGIAKVDSQVGVQLDEKKAIPDYDMVSFAYYPSTRVTGYKVISRVGLRKSLKDKNVRGTKEITHALIFDTDMLAGYAIDYLDDPVFKKYTDIQLNEDEISVDDSVCEMKPTTLEPIDMTNFVSYSLSSTDIYNLGAPAIRSLSEIVNAIFVAKKSRKTAYIVYDPADWELAKEYIKAALKLLPAHIANEISFITCFGKIDTTPVDICGIPTLDDNYIAILEKKGCLVRLDLTGAIGLSGEKVPFADFISKASMEDIENWFAESVNYYDHIKSLDDINDVIKLYLNKANTQDVDNNISVRLKYVTEGIALITRKFDLISNIPYEFETQIDALKSHIETLCAEIQMISIETLYDSLFVPLIKLYAECNKCDIDEKQLIKELIFMVIFGNHGQGTASLRRHFEFISFFNSKIIQELTNCQLDFISYMESKWGFLQNFFEDYFSDAEYTEYACAFGLELLKTLLCDVKREGDIYSEIRDYFVTTYLSVKSNQLVKILDLAFAGTTQNAVFKYALDVLLKLDNNLELHNDRIKKFSNYLIEHKMLEVAFLYFRDKFVAPFGVDAEVVENILGNLLNESVLLPEKHILSEIYEKFKMVQSLIGPHENIGLQKFLYDDFAKRIINPIYTEALASVRFENLSDSDIECYQEILGIYKTIDFSQQIDQQFCPALEELIKQYETYKAQLQREANLVNFRVDFIARELILLDGKTILKVLYEFLGQEKVNQCFLKEGIEGKPQKHEKFLKVCEYLAREFLLDQGNNLSVSDKELLIQKKADFAEEIRRVRNERNSDSRFRRLSDGIRGFIESTILTVVMVVLSAVVGYILYHYYNNGYFKTIYFIFTAITVVISEAMYWYNFPDRRMRNVTIKAAWQTSVILIAMIGLYILTQYILILIF